MGRSIMPGILAHDTCRRVCRPGGTLAACNRPLLPGSPLRAFCRLHSTLSPHLLTVCMHGYRLVARCVASRQEVKFYKDTNRKGFWCVCRYFRSFG